MTSVAPPSANTRAYHPVDISSAAFWRKDFTERDRAFRSLRDEAQITWHQPLEVPYPHDEKGFWAVTRHQDIAQVSMNHDIFISSEGVGVGPLPLEMELMTSFFLAMDPPQHTMFRRIISAAFTPRQVKKIQDNIATNAKEIVDNIVGVGDFDFVERVSSLLPMYTVSDMVGVPRSEREGVRQAAENLIGGGPSDSTPEQAVEYFLSNVGALHAVGKDLAAHRRKNPADDLITNIVQAEIEGQRLTDDQVGAFMILLSSAGNDTTKQTTSHSIRALLANPDQREWLMEDYDGRIRGATEEFVRHASPIISFARRASSDTEIGGQPIAKGEKVAMFYCSGNRDSDVFDAPDSFDLSRNPNPHQGFGGGGIHYCLGNQVAKSQLRSLFHELLTRVPDLELGEPEFVESNFVHGIKHLPAHT